MGFLCIGPNPSDSFGDDLGSICTKNPLIYYENLRSLYQEKLSQDRAKLHIKFLNYAAKKDIHDAITLDEQWKIFIKCLEEDRDRATHKVQKLKR